MPVVTATEISRHFGVHKVLDGVSVTIQRGERVGIVGVNGSGKSTLGRILAGVDSPDSGNVTRRRDARVLYLEQAPRFSEGESACDVALSGLEDWCAARSRYDAASRLLASASGAALDAATHQQAQASEDLERFGGWDLVHRAESILGHLGIADVECDVTEMSGGEQRRVALARATCVRTSTRAHRQHRAASLIDFSATRSRFHFNFLGQPERPTSWCVRNNKNCQHSELSGASISGVRWR